MGRRAGHDTARGDRLLLAGCVAFALMAMALPRPWVQSLTNSLRQTALRPVVLLEARAKEDYSARFRLRTIQAQRDSFALRVQDLTTIAQENDNLRALLALRLRLVRPFLPAEVLHRPTLTDARMLLISVGTRVGVDSFAAVVTADGLLGTVWSVGPFASSVMTWAHPEFRASAVTAEGGVLGLVQPSSVLENQHPLLEMRGVALRDSLALGTIVYTSGLGGVFPRGIPIGIVSGVGQDELGYERIYQIRPFVNPGAVWHVLVLTAPRDSVFLPLPVGEVTP